MLAAYVRRREIKIKQRILKGVYEDNLRINGKAYKNFKKKVPISLNKIFILLVILLGVILINGNNLDFSIFSEKQMAESSVNQKVSLPQAEAGKNISDYREFLGILEQKSFLFPDESLNSLADYNAFLNFPKASLSRMFGLKVRRIIIDPGHGGRQTGTIGALGTKEKDITLDIAKRLRNRLKKYGHYEVLMTRDTDKTVPLNERVDLASINKADLFISIHVNYLPTKPLNTIETYFFGPPSDDRTLKLAERENADSQYGMSDFKELIKKLGNKMKFQESKDLAASIQKYLYLNIKKQDRDVRNFGVKRAPFLVLIGVDVPAVLTEVSCLSNREAEIELNTESHRENIASYLESGILDYLNKGEAIYEAKRR